MFPIIFTPVLSLVPRITNMTLHTVSSIITQFFVLMDHGGITFHSQSALSAVNVHYDWHMVVVLYCKNKNVFTAVCANFF